MNVRIKDIPKLERRRDRLINSGVKSLSDEELLSIILKTGSRNMSVKNLSSYILSSLKGIENLRDINYYDVKKIKGIGDAKACTLVALGEICKRMNRKINTLNKEIGRNDLCPCGSGKKYKNCCLKLNV